MTAAEREVVESSTALQAARRAYSRHTEATRTSTWSALHKARARWEQAVAKLSGIEPWHGIARPDATT